MSADIEVKCDECGKDLETSWKRSGYAILVVTPCKFCLKEAEDKGYDRGRNDGEEADRG